MTNPFELLTLYAAEYYNTSASASTHKSIVYVLGTTILASFLYKRLLQYKQPTTPISRPYNFLHTILLPFQYLYYNFILRNQLAPAPALTVLFEDKYFNEYDEWVASLENTAAAAAAASTAAEEEHKKECLENMYYSTVREKINDFYGDVIMCYDHATFSFAYYARTGNIPYKYLETISRKYMIETNAPREIHVDIREEYKKAKERTQANTDTDTDPAAADPAATDKEHSQSTTNSVDAQQKEEQQHQQQQQDVFVKLKSYNTASNLNMNTTTNDTKEKTHKFVGEHTETATTNNSGNTTDKILREKANRYSYRGKIDDFAQHHKTFLAERRKTATDTGPATDPATPTGPATSTGSSSEASVDGGRNPPSVDGGRNPQRNPQRISYADFKKQTKTRSAL